MIAYKRRLQEVKEYKALERTLNVLNEVEQESLNDNEFRDFCKSTFSPYTIQGFTNFIRAVHAWCVNNFQYTKDDYDETIISPRLMRELRKGDCDDYAVFIKTVLRFFNINSKYILLAREKDFFTHIAVVIEIGKNYLYIDGTNNEFDRFPYERYNFLKII